MVQETNISHLHYCKNYIPPIWRDLRLPPSAKPVIDSSMRHGTKHSHKVALTVIKSVGWIMVQWNTDAMAVEQAGSTLSIRRRPRTNCSGSASDLGWSQPFSVGTSPSHSAERDSKPFLLPGQRSHQLGSASSPGRPDLSKRGRLSLRNGVKTSNHATQTEWLSME